MRSRTELRTAGASLPTSKREVGNGKFFFPQLKGKSKAPAPPLQFDFDDEEATAVTMTDDLMEKFRALHSWGGAADWLADSLLLLCPQFTLTPRHTKQIQQPVAQATRRARSRT